MVDAAYTFLTATVRQSPDEAVRTPWYGPKASLSLRAATGLLVGGQILHGYDVAKTDPIAWPMYHCSKRRFASSRRAPPHILPGPGQIGCVMIRVGPTTG